MIPFPTSYIALGAFIVDIGVCLIGFMAWFTWRYS